MNENFDAIATIEQTNYITALKAGGFTLAADEPTELGGTNSGPAPMDYLHSALASCVAITLKMYVDRKGWNVGKITVQVVQEQTEEGTTKFIKQLSFENEVDAAQETRLLNIAEKCPVAKLLKSTVEQESVIRK